MKTCSKCGFEGNDDLFVKTTNLCKNCKKEYMKKYKIDNKEKQQQYNKQYKIDNKEKQQQYKKQYYINNKVEIQQYNKQYQINNKVEIQQYYKQKAIHFPEKLIFSNAKSRTKRKKNIEFNLTADYLKSLYSDNMVCPLLNIKIINNNGKSAFNSIQLDRIDNSKGYIIGNVWLISMRANLSKSDSTLTEYKRVVNNFRKIIKNGVELNTNFNKNKINLKLKFNSVKHRAKINSILFNIILKDLEEVYPEDGFCPLLGIPLSKENWATIPSLDRIIPELGYVKGNIQIISQKANIMKNDLTIEEMELLEKNWQLKLSQMEN